MAKEVISLRLEPGTKLWAASYAKMRGVSRQDLLESAIESFRQDCERGVPDLKPKPAALPEGVVTGRDIANRSPAPRDDSAMAKQRILNAAKYGRGS